MSKWKDGNHMFIFDEDDSIWIYKKMEHSEIVDNVEKKLKAEEPKALPAIRIEEDGKYILKSIYSIESLNEYNRIRIEERLKEMSYL